MRRHRISAKPPRPSNAAELGSGTAEAIVSYIASPITYFLQCRIVSDTWVKAYHAAEALGGLLAVTSDRMEP